jgi:VWFA-related protein
MKLFSASLLLVPAFGFFSAQPEEIPVVFRSDVSLIRVEVRALDRDKHTIGGLKLEDFVLREEGRAQPIRHFSSEEIGADVLLLLDVSGSMQPHIERIGSAARQMLSALGMDDRMAIIAFDRDVRLYAPFESDPQKIEPAVRRLLQEESFRGGTDITRALIVGASYLELHARPGDGRAIVILTDDQTEGERDDKSVLQALAKADAVLGALIAPDAAHSGSSSDTSQIKSAPRLVEAAGVDRDLEVQLIITRTPTHSAGVPDIALRSGGDSLATIDREALEKMIAGIRSRYVLYFNQPQDAPCARERTIDVELTDSASQRYPGTQFRFKRTYEPSEKTTAVACQARASNP